MCLRYVIENFDHPVKEVKIGWKILLYENNKIKTPYEYFDIQPNKWMISDNENLYSDREQVYGSGFHIFKTREGARNAKKDSRSKLSYPTMRIFKVKYKDVVATGIDRGAKCVVAKKMLVTRDKT